MVRLIALLFAWQAFASTTPTRVTVTQTAATNPVACRLTDGAAFYSATGGGGAASSVAINDGTTTTQKASVTAGGLLKVDASGSTVPVSGTFWQATQPVSGTFWQATQPVSGTVGVSNAFALDATLTGGTAQSIVRSATKGTSTGTGVTSTATDANHQALDVNVNNSVPVTGTFWQATQPVSGTLTCNAGTGTQAVSLASLPALATGSNVIGKVSIDQTTPGTTNLVSIGSSGSVTLLAGANKVGQVAIDQTTPGTTNLVSIGTNGTVGITNAAAVAKGTQGANGIPTQDLKDSGRSARTITLDGFAVAATTETLNTMSYSSDNGTLTTGTSYTVTTGKRLRIQQVTASIHTIAGNTTAATCIVRIRANNAGAALVSSPVQYVMALPGTAAANSSAGPIATQFPDGWEFVAGAGVGVTTTCPGFVTTTAAPKVNISITGFEY